MVGSTLEPELECGSKLELDSRLELDSKEENELELNGVDELSRRKVLGGVLVFAESEKLKSAGGAAGRS